MEQLKLTLRDIRKHFNRKDFKPWPLNYIFYLEASKTGIIPFNIALKKAGFKIRYDNKRDFVGIFKGKKK